MIDMYYRHPFTDDQMSRIDAIKEKVSELHVVINQNMNHNKLAEYNAEALRKLEELCMVATKGIAAECMY
jgi:hypothetical protein